MHLPDSPPLLTINLQPAALAGFSSLLQHGILFAVDGPVPLVPFLLSVPGFSEDYIERTVQTIFINGVAADSLDRDLAAGTTLALSAAMPGLAGAIFRRQGIHACLRSRPRDSKHPAPGDASGFITVKLFNQIATDRVADLLAATILVTGKSWHDFVAMRTALLQPPTTVHLDNVPMTGTDWLHDIANLPLLRLRATCSTAAG